MPGCAGVSAARLAIAYGCVIGAAASSVLGALLVIFLPLNNDLFLASALAFAGGIMSYVSFIDIYSNKAVGSFAAAGFSPALSYLLASVCFFAGFPISYVLDKLADSLVERYIQRRGSRNGGGNASSIDASGDRSSSGGKIHICVQHASPHITATDRSAGMAGAEVAHTGDGIAGSSRATLRCSSGKVEARAPVDLDSGTLAYAATDTTFSAFTCPDTNCGCGSGVPSSAVKGAAVTGEPAALDTPGGAATAQKGQQEGSKVSRVQVALEAPLELGAVAAEVEAEVERSRALVHMGFLAALAVALHNCPEGLVTFVGYMNSIGAGITTAVAITLHNIPEGMVIASSVYYGTKNLTTALMWASIAALTEPLGGLIGLAVVCGGSMTDTVFGILFGLVAGIMVYISLKELLPGARRFDPKDKVTTLMTVLGMVVMSASLTAIMYSQPGGPASTSSPATVTVPLVCTNATAAPAAPAAP
ncbi:hypothetical protein CHLRE_12g530350v5 [Chlamydomonas reinhardtii]|uniref:Zinc transporter n=1 Tax=Chlamydomonas reinhardtii TaxID=3055 RepID=A0A2K3D4S0_CHLRE|nr:uncharacterized protein CHLRE_12g530350v5 [Chlamydomonas reinhardtii]PNW75528.1 hypothetical protein CHLRE_12g530350v5 [Chlamydomonas reinhardtii]